MAARKRRDIETFGLSFLDCICCGFGAIILLLVLSKTAEPMRLEVTRSELEGIVAKLQEQLHEIVGETTLLTRTLESRKEQISSEAEKIARLRGDLSRVRGEFATSEREAAVQNIIEGRLASARQDLSEEMRRVLGEGFRRAPKDTTVGGIPVDSEYIIFVIDTSGSMQRYSWRKVLKKIEETLAVYPKVKGIQVLNDMGDYLFTTYRRRWIPDSPGRRSAILKRLRSWQPFSNSSPVEGIRQAIKSFRDPNKKISIYVFGDEFSGGSIEDVIRSVDTLNAPDASGERPVRIHAVGFPLPAGPMNLQITGIRFATLMRELCERNGGTFVGITR